MADLVLQNLTIKYGAVTAVDNLNIHVASGEFLTLLGPSGCGKSTSLFAVAGLNHATSGTIRVGERVLFDGNPSNTVPPERRNIGLVFQSYALWPHKTVAENLAFPLTLRKIGRAERDERIKEALGLVEMLPYADRYPFELSGGQQQRVAIARALAMRPKVMLFDEVTSALDPELCGEVLNVIRRLGSEHNLTMLMVTHQMGFAREFADRVCFFYKGQIHEQGTPAQIFENPQQERTRTFLSAVRDAN